MAALSAATFGNNRHQRYDCLRPQFRSLENGLSAPDSGCWLASPDAPDHLDQKNEEAGEAQAGGAVGEAEMISLIITIAVIVLGFALWQIFFGGGPPTDGPDIRHGYSPD
jgi:hypothetical protein